MFYYSDLKKSINWFKCYFQSNLEPRAHSRYIHVKQEQHERGPLDLQQLNPDSPHLVFGYEEKKNYPQFLRCDGLCDLQEN